MSDRCQGDFSAADDDGEEALGQRLRPAKRDADGGTGGVATDSECLSVDFDPI